MTHPLPVGTRLVSLLGEACHDEDGNPLSVPPGAVGEVEAKHYYATGQGWTYQVAFENGVWVFIDQLDSIDDPAKYRLADQKGDR